MSHNTSINDDLAFTVCNQSVQVIEEYLGSPSGASSLSSSVARSDSKLARALAAQERLAAQAVLTGAGAGAGAGMDTDDTTHLGPFSTDALPSLQVLLPPEVLPLPVGMPLAQLRVELIATQQELATFVPSALEQIETFKRHAQIDNLLAFRKLLNIRVELLQKRVEWLTMAVTGQDVSDKLTLAVQKIRQRYDRVCVLACE